MIITCKLIYIFTYEHLYFILHIKASSSPTIGPIAAGNTAPTDGRKLVNLILTKALLPNSSISFIAIQEVYKTCT